MVDRSGDGPTHPAKRDEADDEPCVDDAVAGDEVAPVDAIVTGDEPPPDDEAVDDRVALMRASNPAIAGAPSVGPGQDIDAVDSVDKDAGPHDPGIEESAGEKADGNRRQLHAGARHRRDSGKRQSEPRAKRPFWIELPILIVVAFLLTFLIQTFIAKVYYVPSGSMELTLHGTPSGGDRILAYKLVYDFRDPAQSDVVVFKGPDTWAPEADIPGPSNFFGKAIQAIGSVVGIAPPNEKDFVKRVIAVGGQTVSCCDLDGNLVVDHHSLNEPYIYQPIPFEKGVADCTVDPADPTRYKSRRCFAPYTVPEGNLWVMGDHRSESSDSSVYCLGLTAQGVQQYQQTRGDHQTCQRPIPASDVIGKAVAIVMPPSRWRSIGNPDLLGPAATQGSGVIAAIPATGGVIGALGLRGLVALLPGRRTRRRSARLGSRTGRKGPSRS